MVQAHSGAMGGSGSAEFMARTDAGEDLVAACTTCDYAANVETASSRIAVPPSAASSWPHSRSSPRPASSPSRRWPSRRTRVAADRQLKTLIYVADDRPVVAVVRGDHTLSEAKLQTATGASVIRPAQPDEILPLMGARPARWGRCGSLARRSSSTRSSRRHPTW